MTYKRRETILETVIKHLKEEKCFFLFFTLHNFSKRAESPFIAAR